MRLIDADALMREFAEFVRASNNSDFADVPTWNDAVSLLGSAPTIEAEPTKHGRCNACRYMTKDELCTRYEDENGTHSTMPEGYCWLWERRKDEVEE